MMFPLFIGIGIYDMTSVTIIPFIVGVFKGGMPEISTTFLGVANLIRERQFWNAFILWLSMFALVTHHWSAIACQVTFVLGYNGFTLD